MQDPSSAEKFLSEMPDARQMLARMAELIRISRGQDGITDLDRVLRLTIDTVGGSAAVYSTFDSEKDLKITYGLCGDPVDFPTERKLTGTIAFEEFISAGKMFAVYPDLTHTAYTASDPDVVRYGFRSYVGVAVYTSGSIIGALELFDRYTRQFDHMHADALQIIAQAIAFIIAQQKSAKSFLRQQLDENQQLISQMVRLSPTVIYQIDLRTGRFLKVNEQMCLLSGYDEAELLSMEAGKLLTESSRAAFSQALLSIGAGKKPPDTLEFEVIDKNGDTQWAKLHLHYLFEGGKAWAANVVAHDITEQKKVAEELAAHRRELEALVKERTSELTMANLKLRQEVDRRTETAKELRLKSDRLKELNTAMRVLLDKRNEDRLRSEENIRVNLVQLIEPYLDRLSNSGLSGEQQQLLNVIRMNLMEVTGSPMPELSAKYYIFSPTELQVANLIRNGKTTKDMARILNISPRTVESYRENIRNKLGLKNKKVNLKTYLSAKE